MIFRTNSSTTTGFAFPFEAFITGPLRELRAFSLPALNSAMGLAEVGSARTSRMRASISPVSLDWARPRADTMSAGMTPLLSISGRTVSLDCCFEMVPASIKATSAATCPGVIRETNSPKVVGVR